MKPPITGTLPSRERAQLFLRALFDDASCGAAFWNCESVTMTRARPRGRRRCRARGSRGDDAAGDALAVADDQVGDARGELENGRQAAQNSSSESNFWSMSVLQRGGSRRVFDQGGSGVAMARAQARTDGQRAGAVALRAQRRRAATGR
jgi:hypothetical protein